MGFLQQYLEKRKIKKQEAIEYCSEFGEHIALSTEAGRIDDMTELINAEVTHKTFGAGKIVKDFLC